MARANTRLNLDMSTDKTDKTQETPGRPLFPGIRIVLIETSHPGNIGAAARAMKNMGLTRLYLANPLMFPHEKAVWRSASAVDVVNNATVVASLDEALEGCQLIVGTSARDRRIPWPMLEPKSCGERAVAEHALGHEVAIIFGREDRGLKNEELQRCHYHVNIPTGEAYSSLNLAMAVQVLSYEILQAQLSSESLANDGITRTGDPDWDMDFADSQAIELMVEHLEQTLVEVGFHDPENPRQLMTRLRRMFNRIRMDKMEVNILRGFLTAVNRKGRK